jgi:hypothetical protein
VRGVRLACQSLSTLHDLAVSPASAIVTSQHADLPLPDLIEGLAGHYRIELSRAAVDAALQALASTRAMRFRDLIPSVPEQANGVPSIEASAGDIAMAEDALDGFAPLLEGGQVRHCTWPKAIFVAGPTGAPVTGPIELVGRARCLIHGPYAHLPAGRWQADIRFSVADNISGNKLKVDIMTDRIIFEGTCPLPSRGSFQLAVAFDVTEPRLPIELRFHNESGAIEGTFDLHGVTASRVGS